jgi:hypothetical protein
MKFKSIFPAGAAFVIGLSLLVANPAWANLNDDFIFSVKFDEAAKVQALLDQGVNPNFAEEERGETALMIAVREESRNVFAVLLKHPKIQLEATANNGDTALMLASYLGDIQAVTKLLEAGAKVNRIGWSALHYAAAAGDLTVIEFLLAHQADINAASPNKTTPLMMAIRAGKNNAVNLLIARGADLRVKNDNGMNAYDFAVYYEQSTLAKELVARLPELQH